MLIEGTEERPVTGALFESFWRRYLDLDRDYEAIYRSLVRRMGGKMGRCVRFSPGMRVLRQDPFEALISFILSQNNNVPGSRALSAVSAGSGSTWGRGLRLSDTGTDRVLIRGGAVHAALRVAGRIHTGRCPTGGGGYSRSRPRGIPSSRRGAAGAADGSGDRPKGGRLRTVIWIGAARRLSSRRVDETRHGVPVSRESTRRFRTVCRNRTAGDFSLLPLPSAGGTVNYGRFSQEFNKTAGQVVR